MTYLPALLLHYPSGAMRNEKLREAQERLDAIYAQPVTVWMKDFRVAMPESDGATPMIERPRRPDGR